MEWILIAGMAGCALGYLIRGWAAEGEVRLSDDAEEAYGRGYSDGYDAGWDDCDFDREEPACTCDEDA